MTILKGDENMGINAKFQFGEEIKFDGSFYRVTKRTAKYDLDVGEDFATIYYDLKNNFSEERIINLSESEILEEMRLANLNKSN